MRFQALLVGSIVCALLAAAWGDEAFAHGFAGKRFFPATLTIDDPFVADELSLPTVSYLKSADGSKETDFEFEFSKRITSNFGVSLKETLVRLIPCGETPRTGFGNLEVGGKYQVFKSDSHEAILSLGLDAEIGGTGREAVGADSFTTLTPGIFYGKGFGDLPEAVSFLKPLVITGVLGIDLPTRSKNVTVTDDDVDIERNPHVLLGTLLGCVCLGYAWRSRRHRWGAGVVGVGLIGFSIFGVVRHLLVEAYPTTFWRSPVSYDVTSITNGLRLYQANCAAYHGANGHGDGPVGRLLRPPPANLAAAHLGDHTAGDLFRWLGHGIPGSATPGFQERLSESDRWDIINFLRTLAAAHRARSLAPDVAPTSSLIAPDFTFRTRAGTYETLKERRGRTAFHLALYSLPGSRDRLLQLGRAREAIASAGAEIVAVQVFGGGPTERSVLLPDLDIAQAVDESTAIAAAYMIFCQSVADTSTLATPSHLEFLVDRQGHIRARWSPRDGSGWGSLGQLLAQVRQLNKESDPAPTSEMHVH